MYITAEATTGTATESSLTFTSINPTASVSLSVSDPSGTFASSTDAQKAKFSISTTNYTGYTVSLKSSNQNLTDGTNSLSPIPSALSKDDFSLSANTQYNNKWGININNASTFIPVTSNVTIDETSSVNTTAKEYTIALGVRADYTYEENTYYNTFIIEYVANQINYAINYDANAGTDAVTNMPTTPQTGYTNATQITIASATPARSNYEFKGWCTASTSDETCSGTTYQPSATYGIDQTASNEITLHAMWKSTKKTLAQATYLQDPIDCTSSASGTTYTLTDNRDNETYTVAKLADGKCWMLDNLRLNPAATTLTSSNTNVTSTVSVAFTNKTFNWKDTTAAYTSAWYNLASKDATQSYGSGSNKIGGYYNYCAASAGTYCMASGSGSGNASSDLCPAGWRMPTGGSGGEYQTLYNQYGAYYTFKEALRASLSGYIFEESTSANTRGNTGYFWSSTIQRVDMMYLLYVGAVTSVGPVNNILRSVGSSIRCVLK